MNNSIVQGTKKEFKEVLNKRKSHLPKTKRYWQCKHKREYGDYLYSQDRELFNIYYNEWLEELNKQKELNSEYKKEELLLLVEKGLGYLKG